VARAASCDGRLTRRCGRGPAKILDGSALASRRPWPWLLLPAVTQMVTVGVWGLPWIDK